MIQFIKLFFQTNTLFLGLFIVSFICFISSNSPRKWSSKSKQAACINIIYLQSFCTCTTSKHIILKSKPFNLFSWWFPHSQTIVLNQTLVLLPHQCTIGSNILVFNNNFQWFDNFFDQTKFKNFLQKTIEYWIDISDFHILSIDRNKFRNASKQYFQAIQKVKSIVTVLFLIFFQVQSEKFL